MHIVIGNEELCKIYLRKLCKIFSECFSFFDSFCRYCYFIAISYHHYMAISSTQVACDVTCLQYVIQ